jgi:hypothetical protein
MLQFSLISQLSLTPFNAKFLYIFFSHVKGLSVCLEIRGTDFWKAEILFFFLGHIIPQLCLPQTSNFS